MAILRIYDDIAGEDLKPVYLFQGRTPVTYKDVAEQINSIPKDDDTISLRINSQGGVVEEGLAIYDALRASGKKVEALVEGTAASMASVILMAAPKEKRKGRPSSTYLIHAPYSGVTGTAEEIRAKAEELEALQNKITGIYVDRTGKTEEEVRALMKKDKEITAEEAISFGLISATVAPVSAKKKSSLNKNKRMAVSVKDALDALGRAILGKSYGLKVTAADGTELEVEREEGEPQVGDNATPDGEFVMEDGSTIVVEDGVITEIRPADANEEDPDETEEADDAVERLKKEVADLKKQLEDAKKAKRTKEDTEVLDLVKSVGGVDVLRKAKSVYLAGQRTKKNAEAKKSLREVYNERKSK